MMTTKTKKKITKKKTSPLKKYKDSINKLNAEIFELNQKNIRLLAEFDNYKKRNEKEQENLFKYEGIKIIKKILPILDDLDRTLKIEDMKKNKSIYKGILMIVEKLTSSLNDVGVQSFDSLNKEFDIDLHEALMTKKSKSKSNKVIEEFEKGYKYHNKVIRHAKVVVGK